MEGANKVTINQEDLNRIIRNAFGCEIRNWTELTDGWANSAYSLELSDGKSVVLKVAPSKGIKLMRYERNMMKAEVEIMKHFIASGDVPVPRFTFTMNPSPLYRFRISLWKSCKDILTIR